MIPARRVAARAAIASAVIAAWLRGPAHAADVPLASPIGSWLTEDHGAVITLSPCGTALCGRITGMDYNGAMPVDHWHRSQCGLTLIYDMQRQQDGWDGRILNPRSGQVFAARMHVADDGTLRLRGYVGLPLFGATQTWTRYAGGVGDACHMRPQP